MTWLWHTGGIGALRTSIPGWVAGMLVVMPAAARDASDAVERTATAREVVVTAQKRLQDVQDVPISIAVVSGDLLSDLGIRDFDELDRFVPNLYVQATPGSDAFFIRGIGSAPGILNFEQTVGLFVDGIYAGHARQFQTPFFDIERIEVLRGPQGALVGKNTSAGAISIVSARPTRELHAAFESSYEFEQGGTTLSGMVSGPVTDVVSVRLAGQYHDTGGYIENVILGGEEPRTESLFGRASLLIDPDDGFSLLLKIEGGYTDIAGNPAVLNDRPPAVLERSTGGFPGFVDRDYDRTDAVNAAATASFALGEHVLTSITGFSSYDFGKRLDSDFRALPLFASEFREDFEQFSQELRLASPTSGPLEYIVGAYGHINDYDLYQATRTGAILSERIFGQKDSTWSAYASGTYKFSDRLRVSGSLRYTYDRKSAGQRVQLALPQTGAITPIRMLSGRRTEHEWDPAISIQAEPADGVMVYASWGQGSKAGGFVGGAPATLQSQFEIFPEKAESFEAGAKLALLDRRLLWNIAAFSTRFRDLQVSAYVSGSAPPAFYTKNAGRAQSRGFETDLVFRIADGVRFSGALAYLDARYTDFPGANCLWNNPGCDIAANNVAGTRLPRSAKWSGTLSLDLQLPVGGGVDFVANGGMTFRSFAFLEDSLRPEAGQPAYRKFDLRAGVRSADKRWELAIVGRNLTDQLTSPNTFGTPGAAIASPGGLVKYIHPPRTIAVQARLNY